jgi:hypothetical protein
VVSAIGQQTGSELSLVAEPREHVVAGETVATLKTTAQTQFGYCRHATQAPYLRDQRGEKVRVLETALLELIGLKSSLADSIAPARPVLAAPVGRLDAGFLSEPYSAERLAAVGRSGALNCCHYGVSIHRRLLSSVMV